jgi:nicotinate-nucleotide adenylyltransferase
MDNYKRIGIVGGTFNPIHTAHLIIAEIFTEQAQLDKTFFVPANLSPFKIDNDQLNLTTQQQRCEMVELAVKGNPKFGVDSFELDKNGISYSYDTLQHFRAAYPGSDFFILL